MARPIEQVEHGRLLDLSAGIHHHHPVATLGNVAEVVGDHDHAHPELLIADEPTTALDVTIQAQILDLIKRLQRELGMGVIMITHDLGVVAESCDRVVVMYAGRKVEEADVVDLFDRPLHPYTRALMASMPSMNTSTARLAEIPGLVPAPSELGRGCAFADRCSLARDRCRVESPALTDQGGSHVVACFAVQEGWQAAGGAAAGEAVGQRAGEAAGEAVGQRAGEAVGVAGRAPDDGVPAR